MDLSKFYLCVFLTTDKKKTFVILAILHEAFNESVLASTSQQRRSSFMMKLCTLLRKKENFDKSWKKITLLKSKLLVIVLLLLIRSYITKVQYFMFFENVPLYATGANCRTPNKNVK